MSELFSGLFTRIIKKRSEWNDIKSLARVFKDARKALFLHLRRYVMTTLCHALAYARLRKR